MGVMEKKNKRRRPKKRKPGDEDIIWHMEADLYREAIKRDEKRNPREYIF